ncbi:Endonuclease/exonuclease/phosphatase [uncultured Paludibacter sp.]|nr:Endonuclease/exonuclease/phosphatase [uncultured Paludibacter sp.]
MTKFIKVILILANILVVVGLIMVKIGSNSSPNELLLPSYFSFFLFPLAVVNLFFLFFWLFLKKWWFLLPAISFILFFGMIKSSFPINFSKPKIDDKDKKITILSYNTMATAKMKKHNGEKINPVIKYILDSDADIVCLQEFAVSENESQFNEEDFQKYFSKYPYQHRKNKLNRWNMHQGIITLSKYPIINKQDIPYDAKFNLSIYSDIVIGKDTVRVINNHLESNRITARDMQQTAELREDFNSDKFADITKYLSEKLSLASKVRALQADKIARIRKETPYKLIICGDFNDVPSSYAYTKVKGNLNDAFCETETGLGWTFNRSFFRFRIDYIFYDNSFASVNYKRGNLRASDHYPIQADLYFKNN